MLKYVLTFLTVSFFAITAKCQFHGAPVFYFKNTNDDAVRVNTPDSCDFFRVILPPDSGEKLLNIKEYYRDGKLKMAANAYSYNVNYTTGIVLLDGKVIRFYPTGKRQSIANCHGMTIEGLEINYYPNGSLFCTYNYTQPYGDFLFKQDRLLWECYDKNGDMICEKGNGKWVKYNDDFTEIIEEGLVKNGFKEGEWHETAYFQYEIKYVTNYKKGIFKSGISYGKTGKSYSFTEEQEPPTYKSGYFDFFDDVKKYLKIPIDTTGKKMPADNIRISFIIEKDGHLTHFETLGDVDPKLSAAIFDALARCTDWSCRKYCGVPFRSKLTVPLKYLERWDGRRDTKIFDYTENILED